MTDWNPLIVAMAMLLTALATSIPGILAYLSSKRNEIKTDAIMDKVDGNFSQLKTEVAASKAETVAANQRVEVLVERLITSVPAQVIPHTSNTVEKTLDKVDDTTQKTLTQVKKIEGKI